MNTIKQLKRRNKTHHRLKFNDKYVIIRDDNNGNHLRRPIYSDYISKSKDQITVVITGESLLHENNNLKVDYKNNKLSDKISNHQYNFNCRINKKNVYVTIDEKYTAITSKWPKKLPKLPFEPTILSQNNLGEPSMWRVARYVLDKHTNTTYFLKLMPKDIIRGVNQDGKLDRVYKEVHNQKMCSSPNVLSSLDGEEGNFIWQLQEIAPHNSVQHYKNNLYNKTIPEYIALFLFRQILEGVKFIHSKHVLHNFLQLNVLLFSTDYHVKISDFGASINTKKFTTFEQNYFYNLLPTFLNYKSKMVFPPEWNVKIVFNEQTDIWSLGIILYKMLIENESDKKYISIPIQNILTKLLHPDPMQRPTLQQLLNEPCMKTKEYFHEIKLWTFSNFFMEQFKKTFHFKKSVSENYIDKYIKKYLLSFAKPFCDDKHTGWDPLLHKIWYHDQATVTYNNGYKNNIIITQFESDDYFKIDMNELVLDTLPEKYIKYISNDKWQEYKSKLLPFIKKANVHYNNQDFERFKYSDLEKNKERTFEDLPSKMLLQSGTFNFDGDKQVLSLLIKISNIQCSVLNHQKRTTSKGEEFSGNCLYIPLELCEPDVISNIMGSALSEYLVCKKKYDESYCYLTLRKNKMTPKSLQGVHGWHVDGSWGEQTYRHSNIDCNNGIYTGSFTDRNYIIQSTEEIKTPIAMVNLNLDPIKKEAYKKYNEGTIQLLPDDFNEDIILHKYLTGNINQPPFQPPGLTMILDKAVEESLQYNKQTIIELPANNLNFFTAYTIHTVPSNKTNKEVTRKTCRIAFSCDYFDKACGPTISPVLGIPGTLQFFPYPEPYKFDKNVNLINKLF